MRLIQLPATADRLLTQFYLDPASITCSRKHTQTQSHTNGSPDHLPSAPPPQSACLSRSCRPSPAAQGRFRPSSRPRRPSAGRTCGSLPRRGRQLLRKDAKVRVTRDGCVRVCVTLRVYVPTVRERMHVVWWAGGCAK